MCFFRKKRERKRALEAEKAALAQKQAEQAAVVEKKVEEPKVEQKPQPTPPVTPVVEKKVVAKEDVKVTQEQAPVEKEVPKTEVKPAPKVEEKPVVQEEQAEEEVVDDKSKTPKVQKYHVSQNKDEDSENFKKWRVRKEGSTKTIKFFDTQKEAIAFAEQLAESAGSSVVIHKVDGSIRKQDYTKKES